MELNEFLEKYLPDYNQKSEVANKRISNLLNNPQSCTDVARDSKVEFIEKSFVEKYFPEALQNFADKICEKQRENCYELSEIDYGSWDGWGDIPKLNKESVMRAKQPKIDEL